MRAARVISPDTTIARPIALITPRYWPATGGVERHVERLAEGLSRRGIASEVLAVDSTGTLPVLEEHNNVLIRRFPALWHDTRFIASPSLSTWLHHNSGCYSLLHAHSYHTLMPLQAAIAGRHHRIPLIVTPHYHGTGHTPLRRVLHGPYRLLGHWAMRQSNAIICLTEGERSLIHRHFGPVPAALEPGGVDPDEIMGAVPRARRGGETLIMTASRLENYKQTDLVLAALHHLPDAYRVIVVGEGPARPHLEREIARLRVGRRIQMLGHVSRAELLSWYRTADVFVSLSRMEALGLTLMEALAAGASVVASDIPAHREVATLAPAERTVFTAVVPSARQVADAVQRAAQIERLSAVNVWSLPTWEGMVDGTISLYREALRSRPHVAFETMPVQSP